MSQISDPLYDYGKLYSGVAPYNACLPESIEEVQAIVLQAQNDSTAVRVRASGHTFNGCSLPRSGETLLRTNNLDWFRFEQRGSVTVGAGAVVWDIRDLVEEQRFDMPVYNGGWAGPSLGGYISAGGFGKGALSEEHGGLWENILSITLVDGLGTIHTIERSDERFKWLFGCYGQLGIVVEAKLMLIPNHPAAVLTYPKGSEGKIPRRQVEDPRDNDQQNSSQGKILFWFSLLISPEQEPQAWREVAAFCERHQGIIVPDGGWAGPVMNGDSIGYHYNINFHNFNPPLLYPRDEKFIVMGVMSFLTVSHHEDNVAILDIETDFIDLAIRNGFKLYLQAENIGRSINYKDYYSDPVFERFEQLKLEFDPNHLINPGVVFLREDSVE